MDLSKTSHSQTNGQSKRTILILEDIMRACVIDPLAELAYKNNYLSNIQIALYKVLYSRVGGLDVLLGGLSLVRLGSWVWIWFMILWRR